MNRSNRSIVTVIAFGLMASATFAEGSRPPRLSKLEARAPIGEMQLRRASGASGPDDSERTSFRFVGWVVESSLVIPRTPR